jgi:hypothetical protein
MNKKVTKEPPFSGESYELDIRKKIITLPAIGLTDFAIISFYQTGVLKKLPYLPGNIFDSNKVNSSPVAYIMGIPDGPISAVVFFDGYTLHNK